MAALAESFPIPRLPANLQVGIRTLEDVLGFTLEGPWQQLGDLWTTTCRVDINDASEHVDAMTRWSLVLSDRYPHGPLRIWRAPDSGLRGAFPHELVKDVPCLITRAQPLGRWDTDPEPFDAYGRLAWHAVRLVRWVEKAACSELLRPGDLFGHPLIDNMDKGQSINTLEDHCSLDVWKSHFGQSGEVKLLSDSRDHHSRYAVEFSYGGQNILTPPWGSWVTSLGKSAIASWVLLGEPPFLPPWGFPATWGEMRETLQTQGIALDPILRQAVGRGLAGAPLVMLGYPVPSVVGGTASRIEWQACALPPLGGMAKARGFRDTPKSRWLKARQDHLGSRRAVTWHLSQNHQPDELGSRGFLPEAVRTQRYALIGAGALGSAIAEHLGRTGVTDIVILDKDSIQTRNLVRHTLTLHDVPQNKAEQVAGRLRAITALVRPVAFGEQFPPSSEAATHAVEGADVIIDTTGEEQVLADLGQRRWSAPKAIISLSLGWKAQALYAYAERTPRFNARSFHEAIDPHVSADLEAKGSEPAPMEGIGCWSPVFPALHTDVQLLAAVGATFVREFLESQDKRRVRVYEQLHSDEGFGGVRVRDGGAA